MSTLRPLGVGSQILIHGDKMAGFYGEVNGIITADELRSMTGVSQGTPMQTGDITWLKFSHNYKTLYIAKQPIQHSISWDYLQSLDLVFGKMVEIGGKVYLLRLIQGANINANAHTQLSGYNSEWDNLIVNSVNTWNIYTAAEIGVNGAILGRFTWCQEILILENRITRGGNSVINGYGNFASNRTDDVLGWRPILELLY